jgi:hypothetical protein
MVLQPDNLWFKGISNKEAIDEVLDSIEDGTSVEDYLLS